MEHMATQVGTPGRRLTASSIVRFGLVAAAGVCVGLAAPVAAQDDNRREVSISAREGAFHPATVEVRQNDLVKVTFTAEDGPHSFNVDAYRIAKRARPGRPAVFEFRADQAGRFPYYCKLSEAGSPHDMHGELIVRER
jgi:plastocyanin